MDEEEKKKIEKKNIKDRADEPLGVGESFQLQNKKLDNFTEYRIGTAIWYQQ